MRIALSSIPKKILLRKDEILTATLIISILVCGALLIHLAWSKSADTQQDELIEMMDEELHHSRDAYEHPRMRYAQPQAPDGPADSLP